MARRIPSIVVLDVSFATQANSQGTLVAATPADPQHFNPGGHYSLEGFQSWRGQFAEQARAKP